MNTEQNNLSRLTLNNFAPPGFMKIIYPDTLIGCNLQDLAQIQIDLDPEEIKGKVLLLFIWDMQQRHSRAIIKELASQTKNLEQKDLVIICIQTSKVNEDELKEWTKTNGISFPVIISETNEQQTHLSLGARSLP